MSKYDVKSHEFMKKFFPEKNEINPYGEPDMPVTNYYTQKLKFKGSNYGNGMTLSVSKKGSIDCSECKRKVFILDKKKGLAVLEPVITSGRIGTPQLFCINCMQKKQVIELTELEQKM